MSNRELRNLKIKMNSDVKPYREHEIGQLVRVVIEAVKILQRSGDVRGENVVQFLTRQYGRTRKFTEWKLAVYFALRFACDLQLLERYDEFYYYQN